MRGKLTLRTIVLALLASVLVTVGNPPTVSADQAPPPPKPVRDPAQAIATGDGTTCVILDTGDISCWGKSDLTGRGIGFDDEPSPRAPLRLGRNDATDLAVAEDHVCAIVDLGDVTCWGENFRGQLGVGDPNVFELLMPSVPFSMPNSPARRIATGLEHSCALLENGQVTCWGRNHVGQLGNGDPTGTSQFAPITPLAMPNGLLATDIVAGEVHTCALLDNGQVSCWGANNDGQLGIGDPNGFDQLQPFAPVSMPNNRIAVGIAAGGLHTCALLDNGQVTCWGNNFAGQLGTGNGNGGELISPSSPFSIPGGNAVGITAGFGHTCAVLDTGQISCWGDNDSGQVGVGDTNGAPVLQPSPSFAAPGGPAIAVAGGREYTCAALASGQVTCWGGDSFGELGNGPALTGTQFTPGGNVTLAPRASVLSAGDDSTCAVRDGERLSCWGSDASERLGNGPTAGSTSSPGTPDTLETVAVDADDSHACSAVVGGAVWCWGSNAFGKLGGGLSTPSQSAVPILAGVGNAIDVGVGNFHSCALRSNGQVACWGANFSNQLGDGTSTASTTPQTVNSTFGGSPAVTLTVGGSHSCVTTAAGAAWCWGTNNFSTLGNGGTAPTTVPVQVSGIDGSNLSRTAMDITAGGLYTCALMVDRTAKCWGNNSFGELGNGGTPPTSEPTPVDVLGLNDATALSAGDFHTCALRLGGAVTCWGSDADGQLATGPVSDPITSPPPPINLGVNSAVAVSAGAGHTCVVLGTGDMQCWGRDDEQQLGNGGTPQNTDTPGNPIALREPVKIFQQFVPDAPTDVIVGAGGLGQIVVGWTAPVDDGGADIISYTATAQPSGQSCTTTMHTTCTMFGVPGGVPQTVTVIATNGLGNSSPSAPAAPITIITTSLPPSNVTGTPGDASAVLSWSPPTSTGGQPLTGYTATVQPGGAACSTTATSCTITGLTNGTAYTATVIATNAVGDSGLSEPSPAFTPAVPNVAVPPIVTVTPARLYETRSGPNDKTVDRLQEGTGKRTAGQITTINVAGRGGVAPNATGAIFNIAAVGPDGPGFFTAYPCNAAKVPLTSTLNYAAGQVIANGATVKLDPNGNICILTSAAAGIVIDVTGFIPAGGALTTVTPARLYETRSGPNDKTVDNLQEGTGKRTAGQITTINVAGRPGIPADATGAIFNIAAVSPDGPGFFTAYPCNAAKVPLTSTLNYAAGQVIANGATVKLDPNGNICILTLAAADLVVDVTAFIPAGSTFTTVTPARLYETRNGPDDKTFDGQQQATGRRSAGQITTVNVTGRHGIPAGATGATINIAAVNPAGPGVFTAYPCNAATPPLASTLNHDTGGAIANGATVKLDPNGNLCIITSTTTDLVVDVTAYIPA